MQPVKPFSRALRVRTQRERIGKATAAEVMMMKWMQIELIRPFFTTN
jgi:hypothetical protein